MITTSTAHITSSFSRASRIDSRQRGFTMIETMIAIAIMSVGLLTLIAAFATAVNATQNAQETLVARQQTLESMENIYTARNAQQLTFSQIANVSSGESSPTGRRNCWPPVRMDWSTPPTIRTIRRWEAARQAHNA